MRVRPPAAALTDSNGFTPLTPSDLEKVVFNSYRIIQVSSSCGFGMNEVCLYQLFEIVLVMYVKTASFFIAYDPSSVELQTG